MKRMYYGSVTMERPGTRPLEITTVAALAFAASEAEAKGWAVTQAMERHPGATVSLVQMVQIPDEYVLAAAQAIQEAAGA